MKNPMWRMIALKIEKESGATLSTALIKIDPETSMLSGNAVTAEGKAIDMAPRETNKALVEVVGSHAKKRFGTVDLYTLAFDYAKQTVTISTFGLIDGEKRSIEEAMKY